MTFAERMKDLIDKGAATSKDLAQKAGEKARELGAKGTLKVEIMQLQSQAQRLIGKLGSEVYSALVESNQATVGRDNPNVSALLKQIEGVRASIEAKEKEYRAVGGRD
jgi:capsule polysaccharide export protein KpsE/RkpR